MDHAGLAEVAEQILDDRLAGDADFPDAAVERASGTPNRQELADLGARYVIAHRQGGDEGGQGGRQASLSSRSRERPGTSTPTPGRAATAGALEGMIAVPHAGDRDAVRSRSSTKWALWRSRTAWRRRRRGSDNGSRHARPEEARTARSLCCRAACRACDRTGAAVQVLLRAVMPAAGGMAGPCRSGSPMTGQRDYRRRAAATRNPGPASRPARSPAHAGGTAARPGLSASKKRRSMPDRSTGPLLVMPPIESEPAR
jgi:hypothetical protein